jgi:multiple sugar transport system permease protein
MQRTTVARPAATARPRRWGLERREEIAGWLFALPAILGFVVWWLGPMLFSIAMSLTDWGLLSPPHFLGLANYIGNVTPAHPIPGLVYDPLFWKSLAVTAYFTALAVPASLVVAFLIALMLAQPLRLVGLFRAIYYLPSILPLAAIALTWLWLYNPDFGLFNVLLDWAGLPTSPFLSDESTVIPSLALMSVWSSGGLMIIFLAAIKGVPVSLHEAAAIDGAGALRRLWHVTVPAISPVILFNLLTSIIGSFAAGIVQAQFMTNGGPNNASLFFSYYLYRTAFQDGHMGYATAMSWVLFVLLLALTLLIFAVARSRVYYEEPGTA